jgi:hypothetical protein
MREAVERRLAELEKQLEQTKAQANALAGAVAVLTDLLAKPEAENDAPTE